MRIVKMIDKKRLIKALQGLNDYFVAVIVDNTENKIIVTDSKSHTTITTEN